MTQMRNRHQRRAMASQGFSQELGKQDINELRKAQIEIARLVGQQEMADMVVKMLKDTQEKQVGDPVIFGVLGVVIDSVEGLSKKVIAALANKKSPMAVKAPEVAN
jgi:MinD superfamily P-loop ATPase